MITAERDQLRMPRANARRFGRQIHRLPTAQLQKRLIHLPLGQAVIEGSDGDIATISDLGPRFVGVDAGAGVVTCAGHLAGAGRADGTGPEAGAWSVGDGRVEGGTDDGDIVVFRGFHETFDGAKVSEAGNAGEGPLE